MKSEGVNIVSATSERMADDFLRIRFLLCKIIIQWFEHCVVSIAKLFFVANTNTVQIGL